jgi:nucleotide-binding universal stress UspA family protein
VSREEVRRELSRVLEAAGAWSDDVTLAAEAGDPFRTILDRSVAIGADLIVMGTHGRSGFERAMVGSVAEKVLRKAPCPVLMVPPDVTATMPDHVRFRHVLSPMDFSPAALQAFGFALDLAGQADGSVTVLHVVEWLPEEEPRALAHFNVPEFRGHLIEDARRRVQTLIAEEPRAALARDKVVVGRAHREILRIASESPTDLIVMGAQGRGGFGLTLFGSTTQEVVRAAPCPVLTVRAAEPVN